MGERWDRFKRAIVDSGGNPEFFSGGLGPTAADQIFGPSGDPNIGSLPTEESALRVLLEQNLRDQQNLIQGNTRVPINGRMRLFGARSPLSAQEMKASPDVQMRNLKTREAAIREKIHNSR